MRACDPQSSRQRNKTPTLCTNRKEWGTRKIKVEPQDLRLNCPVNWLSGMIPSDKLPIVETTEEKYCKSIMETLWDTVAADELLYQAVSVVDDVAGGNFDRDAIRTEAFTANVQKRCEEIKK
jgi:hypothetical protein